MTTVAIPAWNVLGLLPPIDPDLPTSPDRSPYPVSLKDVVMRFSTSPERQSVLKGFLGYRAELHRLGLADGFQWIDGSFLEDVETIERRVPRDIDVVSFFHTPANVSVSDEDARLFDQAVAKDRFKVDAYFVELDQVTPRELTFWSAYWYSMWSHRRTQAWKGFLQIELAPTEDAEALAWLAQFEGTGEQS
ncbi:MAG: hypothetical protein V5B60_08610 [Accumulibacter sp.]|jgi:hypothetical protein|uniref:DUF6932 family protein n=1 Tax=Accumulibacter sp. TaxID=2053492 RepID=UPI002FC3CB1C